MWMPQHLRSPALDPRTGDPYFANVVLLAGNESGADGTTTFLDQSSYARTLTAVGNAQWDTGVTPPPSLTSTILLDGTGDYLTAADAPALQLVNGTIEGMVYFNSTVNQTCMVCGKINTAGTGDWSLFYNPTIDKWRFVWNNGGVQAVSMSNTWVPTLNTWYHIEGDRDGNNFYFFIDGVQQGTTQVNAVAFADTAAIVSMGAFNDGTSSFNGNLASIRVTNVARHTANFTPPTPPLPTS